MAVANGTGGFRVALAARRGALFHLFGCITVLFVWRFMSLPSLDTLGILIPLAWLLTGLLFGKGDIPRYSPVLLSSFLLFAVFWTVGPLPRLLASASALAGILPGMVHCARRTKYGYFLAVIPILPIVILQTPFVHDEPYYSTITENFLAPDADVFGDMNDMSGNPSESVKHHQPLYPLLMIPGYPLGETGMRLVNVIMAFGAAILLGRLFRREEFQDWRLLVFLGLLTIPGIGTLGIVYPEWLAIMIFCIGILVFDRRHGLLWLILITVLFALLKERFALLGVGLLIAWMMGRSRRTKYRVILASTAVLVAILFVDLFLLSGRLFVVRYGNIEFVKAFFASILFRMPTNLQNIVSSMIDIESGFLWKAPWIMLACAGMPALRRKHPKAFRLLLVPSLLYLIMLFVWKPADWHSMPTPPGRMLTPVLPLLLASLSMKLGSKPARLLIALSLAVSVLHVASPVLRFNDADGTDLLFSTLTGPVSRFSSLVPSCVRPELIPYITWSVVTAGLVWIAAKGRKGTGAVLLCLAVFVGAEMDRPQTSWEAEDISGKYLDHCSLYPENRAPVIRRYWHATKELMLTMSEPEDAIHLPVPGSGDDSLFVRIRCRTRPSLDNVSGLYVICGAERDSVLLRSEFMQPPFWYGMLKSVELDPVPENSRELIADFAFPHPGAGSVISIYHYGKVVYLDRVELGIRPDPSGRPE